MRGTEPHGWSWLRYELSSVQMLIVPPIHFDYFIFMYLFMSNDGPVRTVPTAYSKNSYELLDQWKSEGLMVILSADFESLYGKLYVLIEPLLSIFWNVRCWMPSPLYRFQGYLRGTSLSRCQSILVCKVQRPCIPHRNMSYPVMGNWDGNVDSQTSTGRQAWTGPVRQAWGHTQHLKLMKKYSIRGLKVSRESGSSASYYNMSYLQSHSNSENKWLGDPWHSIQG